MKFLFALCVLALVASTVSAATIKWESVGGTNCNGNLTDATYYVPTSQCIPDPTGSGTTPQFFWVNCDASNNNTIYGWTFPNSSCTAGAGTALVNTTSGTCLANGYRFTCNANAPSVTGGNQRLRQYTNSTCSGNSATGSASFSADKGCNKFVTSVYGEGANAVIAEGYIQSTAACSAGTALSVSTYYNDQCTLTPRSWSFLYISVTGMPDTCLPSAAYYGIEYFSIGCSSAAALVAGPVAMLVAVFAIFSQKMF